MEFLKDLFLFMKERKKIWLVPIVLLLVLLGLVIVLGSGSALAPVVQALPPA